MSTQREIAKMYKDIQNKLSVARRDLAELQATCLHPSPQKTHRANTGNYDPSSDCYWTDFACLDCGKSWTKEGSL